MAPRLEAPRGLYASVLSPSPNCGGSEDFWALEGGDMPEENQMPRCIAGESMRWADLRVQIQSILSMSERQLK